MLTLCWTHIGIISHIYEYLMDDIINVNIAHFTLNTPIIQLQLQFPI